MSEMSLDMFLFQETMMNMEKPLAKSAVTPEQLPCYPPVSLLHGNHLTHSRSTSCIQNNVMKNYS